MTEEQMTQTSNGKAEKRQTDPENLERAFKEYREVVSKDAQEKRYEAKEPLADSVVGLIG